MSSGLLLLDKPRGMSSFRALAPAKRLYGTRRIGHTGTLDPFASGLMLVLVGKATRLAQWLLPMSKRYVATVRFGETTDTLDPEGTVTDTGPIPGDSDIQRVLPMFIGEISQVPPAYSAVKVGGERAYRLARAGDEPAIKARTVHVDSLAMTRIDERNYNLELTCGSGTYVRSLARDIAARMETVAHLVELRRVSVGPFKVAQASTLEDAPEAPALIPIPDVVAAMPTVETVTLSSEQNARVRRGAPIAELGLPERPPGDYALRSIDGCPEAIAAVADGRWKFRWVLART